MQKNWPEIAKELSGLMTVDRKEAPDTRAAFSTLGKVARAPGALDPKTTERIALVLGIDARCDGELALHARAVRQLGGTRAEVLDTISIGVYRGGGPSAIYSAQALETFDQLTALSQ